jgi:hypothetical protein
LFARILEAASTFCFELVAFAMLAQYHFVMRTSVDNKLHYRRLRGRCSVAKGYLSQTALLCGQSQGFGYKQDQRAGGPGGPFEFMTHLTHLPYLPNLR